MNLASLEWWAFLGVIAVIWSIVLGVRLILKKGNFSFGKSGIKLSGSKQAELKISNVKVEIAMSTLVAIQEEIQDTEREIDRIRYYETVREQMSFIERQLKIGRGKLREKFLELRAKYLQSDASLLSDPIYKHYNTALRAAEEDLLDFARYVCGQNHFLERTPDEFTTYLEELKKEADEEITLSLNMHYVALEPPDRKEIQKANDEIADDYLNLFAKGIRHARDVASKNDQKIKTLRANLSVKMVQIIPEYQCVASQGCL